MGVDLTKLKSTTLVPGFKNNDEFSGSFAINGSFNSGTRVVTKTITLPDGTDEVDIIFKGRANGGFAIPTDEPRSNSAWFKRGSVFVRADGSGYNNFPMRFDISARIKDNILTIQATALKQFEANLSLTSETVQYKLIDYSVF